MAQTRVIVDKALLINQITTLNDKLVADYEKAKAEWEKSVAKKQKAQDAIIKKVISALAKQTITDINVRADYRWSQGYGSERKDYTSINIEVDCEVEALGGSFRSQADSAPTDPRTLTHGDYHERQQMLKTLELSSKTEISLPVSWSSQYL